MAPSLKDVEQRSGMDAYDAEFARLVSEQIQSAARRAKKELPVSEPPSHPESRHTPGIYPWQPAQETSKWPITIGAVGLALILISVIAYGLWPKYDYSVPEAMLREAQKIFKEAETADTLVRLAGFVDAILATNPPETERGKSLRNDAMNLRAQVDQAQKDLTLFSAALDASRTANTGDQRDVAMALLAQFVAVKSDMPFLIKSQNEARHLMAAMSVREDVPPPAEAPPPPASEAEEVYRRASALLDKATTTKELDDLIAKCRTLLKQPNVNQSLRKKTEDLIGRAITSRKVLEKYSGR
jgi:hypothetical protein